MVILEQTQNRHKNEETALFYAKSKNKKELRDVYLYNFCFLLGFWGFGQLGVVISRSGLHQTYSLGIFDI